MLSQNFSRLCDNIRALAFVRKLNEIGGKFAVLTYIEVIILNQFSSITNGNRLRLFFFNTSLV